VDAGNGAQPQPIARRTASPLLHCCGSIAIRRTQQFPDPKSDFIVDRLFVIAQRVPCIGIEYKQ
jgi:hypothetical protein